MTVFADWDTKLCGFKPVLDPFTFVLTEYKETKKILFSKSSHCSRLQGVDCCKRCLRLAVGYPLLGCGWFAGK